MRASLLLVQRSAFIALFALAALGGAACGNPDVAAPGAAAGAGGQPEPVIPDLPDAPDGPPDPNAVGLCGNEFLAALEDPPNLYFVLDRSGSMSDFFSKGVTKLDASLTALDEVLQALGHRINFGAAVFPSDQGECFRGGEVFSTRPGDPLDAKGRSTGKERVALLHELARHAPTGATPTHATLVGLVGKLQDLPGRTAILLFTDGGPNCDGSNTCSSEECIWDIERQQTEWGVCGVDLQCCADFEDGPLACIDHRVVDTAQALNTAGLPIYVIGLPGAEPYETLLNAMARAAGTAREGTVKYYAVTSAEALVDTLSSITLRLALTCDLALAAPPPDPTLVNVYFDRTVVPQDPADGWVFTGASSLQLRGAACSRLLSGDVRQVQIVSGCPVVLR